MTTEAVPVVDIRPDSDIYETYRRLSYRAWYAIAEFVDNATWNFSVHRAALSEAAGRPATLRVDVLYDRDKGSLSVIDNAMGMNLDEFQRALRLAKPPANTSGRSEFGMGLKTAACWLGPRWRVTSKRLGESEEYSALVDVARLKADKPESLAVEVRAGIDPSTHYTRVEVDGLDEYDRVFVGRTLGKIKSELASMYRRDLESGVVTIAFNGEALVWQEYELLREYTGAGDVLWRRDIDILVRGKRVTGWIGLLAKGKAADAGFHMFRRNRIIQGGTSNGWKPWEIFGAPNSFQSQRLIGELDFDDWLVSHTKDHIVMSGADEVELLEQLRVECGEYIQKARERRGAEERPTLSKPVAESTIEETKEELEDSPELGSQIAIIEEAGILPEEDPTESAMVAAVIEDAGKNVIEIEPGGQSYPKLIMTLSDTDGSRDPLVRIGFPDENLLLLALNLRHPFIEQFVGDSERALKVLAHTLYVDAMVERMSRRRPELTPQQLRQIKDHFLRGLRANE